MWPPVRVTCSTAGSSTGPTGHGGLRRSGRVTPRLSRLLSLDGCFLRSIDEAKVQRFVERGLLSRRGVLETPADRIEVTSQALDVLSGETVDRAFVQFRQRPACCGEFRLGLLQPRHHESRLGSATEGGLVLRQPASPARRPSASSPAAGPSLQGTAGPRSGGPRPWPRTGLVPRARGASRPEQ